MLRYQIVCGRASVYLPIRSEVLSLTPTLKSLFAVTIKHHIAPEGRVVASHERPLPEQGWSGATIRVYDVEYESEGERATVALATKDARSVERRVLTLLSEQGHVNVPYASCLESPDDERALVCMRAITPDGSGDASVMNHAAVALAGIHAANLGKRERLGWLPPADRAYMNGGYVLENWRNMWALTMGDREFADVYGVFEKPLLQAADLFLHDMETLWTAGDTLTLIHGDLHDGNVLVEHGTPYFIDWEQALYGTLYYDLPNYLTLDQSIIYRDALAERGVTIAHAEFERGYRAASRMIGFKYMGFWLGFWRQGGTDRDRSREPIQSLIDTAINGKD